MLTRLHVKNYRSLADVTVELRPVNVLSGPNGAGKSSLLDVLWFLRGCAAQGVDETASERSHGIGLLWDGAPENAGISIEISTETLDYDFTLKFLSGRIDPMAGERVYSRTRKIELVRREPGTAKVHFLSTSMQQPADFDLREPEKISLPRFADYDPGSTEVVDFNNFIRFARFYHFRSMRLYGLRKHGSESGRESWLFNQGDNLFSVLRNLQGRRAIDDSYETIIGYMRRAFPRFRDLVFDQSGPASVYCSFVEAGLRHPVNASGVSDGHLQMLLLLTALFAENRLRDVKPGLVAFDEPETSLHPWPIAVLAEAIEEATSSKWRKQVLLATHSPVLLGQYGAENILVMEPSDRGSVARRLSDVAEIRDLLEHYSPGTLYMSELVGAQSGALQSSEP